MKKGDYIYTPRFCGVRIEEVYETRQEAEKEGYTEPTHYWDDPVYGIQGKHIRSVDEHFVEMRFAAFKK